MVRGEYTGKYLGKEICGFTKDHIYQIEISNNGRTYEVYASEDRTDDKTVDLSVNYASETSIRRNWELKDTDTVTGEANIDSNETDSNYTE